MSPGKIASQAGHAYIGALLSALKSGSPLAQSYAQETPGTKVCLQASLLEITRLQAILESSGIPSFVVIDSGCPNFFDGQPILTAIGFGPSLKHEVKHLTKKLKLL